MAAQDDVRRICSKLPGAVEGSGRFAFEVPVSSGRSKGRLRGFCWSWAERVDPTKARVISDDVLAASVPDLTTKDLLLASDSEKFCTEPHYNGDPAVLVRLEAIGAEELEDLLVEAWKCKAPKDLVKEYEERGLQPACGLGFGPGLAAWLTRSAGFSPGHNGLMKAVGCSFVLALATLCSAPASKPETLEAMAKRAAKSLLAADWAGFRKDASPKIVIEERWTGYEQYFEEKEWPKAFEKGILGEHEFRAASFFTTVPNSARLSAAHRKVFRAFCKVVQDSHRSYGGTSREWPWIAKDGEEQALDHYKVVGPSAIGKIASNLDWLVEFERNSGVWKARRLILGGH